MKLPSMTATCRAISIEHLLSHAQRDLVKRELGFLEEAEVQPPRRDVSNTLAIVRKLECRRSLI